MKKSTINEHRSSTGTPRSTNHDRQSPANGNAAGPAKFFGRVRGFTLTELVIVVAVLAIIAYFVVPVASPAATVPQLQHAAQILSADIAYCQSACINNPNDPREMVFNLTTDSYSIVPVAMPTTAVINRADGRPYVVQLGSNGNAALNGVGLTAITGLGGGSVDTLAFDKYGVPVGLGGNATFTLSEAGRSVVVTVNSVTGEVAAGALQ